MGASGTAVDKTLAADTDITEYLSTVMESDGPESPDFEAVKEYLSQRDFDISPLHPDTAIVLLNLFTDDVSADVEENDTLQVWAPASNGQLEEVTKRLSNWGYEINDVSRVNRTIGGVPVVGVTARQSPSPKAQLNAISNVTNNEMDAFCGYLLLLHINGVCITDGEEIAETWSELFAANSEALAEKFVTVGSKIHDKGGVPGTERYISHHGGVEITIDNTDTADD